MSNGNNIYNILGKLKGISDTAALTPDIPTETVYENVEPRGSITEAVRSLESKYQTFKESAKPDFLDVDKDGNKKEAFKKAVKDKKAVEEGTIAKPQTDLKKHSATAKRMAAQKKADKDWNDSQAAKQATNEGAGPYTLDDPKHPKFKANYEKYKKAHPDCTLAEFVAAMRKKEKGLAEAAYDEPAAPDAEAIAKRKRLQAIKDRQEEQGDDYSDSKSNVRKVAGKAYGGAAQKDSPESDDLDEVAPPGAKAERMVKHIKKGYANDGKLTKKEKGIAYATAWKAHNKGQVEEGVEFKDAGKIKNSAPNMKKAKLAKVTESRVMEETDYFYEKVAKSLCGKNPNLDTASGEFVDAVRKEMVAQGIEPNRARNILLMDEDFISDVASSYGHYCKEVAESGAPVNSFLSGAEELDEIARLAGLPVAETDVQQEIGLERSDVEELDETSDEAQLDHYNELVKQGMDSDDAEVIAFNDEGDQELDEADVAEGNEFSGALAAAKASGAKEFEVGGKRYTVKEDINVNITASGEEDALNLFRKLAGMNEVEAQPGLRQIELPQDAESAIAQGIVEPIEVDEERDIEYVNTPNEKIGGIDTAIPSGTDLHRSKQQYKKEYPGDNPMAVKEQVEDSLWKKYSGMLKSLIK